MRICEVCIVIIVLVVPYTFPYKIESRSKNAGFFFSMPQNLRNGRNETVCLSLHHSHVPAKTILDLKVKEKHYFTDRHLDSEHSCFELYVPQFDLQEPQLVSVRAQVQLNGIIYSAHSQDPILLHPDKRLLFIETDRSLYKTGDRVKIRLLVLNQDLVPDTNYKVPEVRIKNPLDISVIVWENLSTEMGLIQLEHQMTQESLTGKWKVEAGEQVQYFQVNKYVLPNFKIQLVHPRIVYSGTKSINVSVCAKYTYGKNVRGTAFLRVSDSHHNMNPIQSIKEMLNGCANFTYTGHDLVLPNIKDKFTMYDPKIQIYYTATVTEHGTDKVDLTEGKSLVQLKAYTIKFDNTLNTFLPGVPYEGKVVLSNVQTDLTGEVIEICYNVAIKRSWNYLNNEHCSNFSANGTTIPFHVLPLKANVIHLHIHARSLNHTNIGDNILVIRLYSPSSSYIYLEPVSESIKCDSAQQFLVHFTTDKFREHDTVTFYYMIKTRGYIYKLRKHIHTVRKHSQKYDFKDLIGSKHKFVKTGGTTDKFVLKFNIKDQKILTKYQVLVYYVTNHSEVVTAVKDVEIEPCLSNKVKAEWSRKEAYPGTPVSLSIETSSESLCSVSSVDKSTRFLGQPHNINLKALLKIIDEEKEVPQSNRKSCIPPTKKNREAAALTQIEDDLRRRRKRFVYSFSEDYDAYDLFQKFGTVIITNLKVISKLCYTGPTITANTPVQFLTDQYDTQNEDKIASIRSHFPETWLWELVPVRGDDVPTEITRNLPHTITNWITNVLCVSNTEGVGFIENLELSAFQPFFVDVATPYSMKRGETLHLHVTLFNYLNYSLPMRLTMRESAGLKLNDAQNRRTVSFCISNSTTVTRVYEIQASELGKMNITVLAEIDSAFPGKCGPDVIVNKRDVVFKELLVEPEGYRIKTTKSALICSKPHIDNVTWSITVPNGIVSKTDKARITINGDLLGSTIENLENLIDMPTGCGEQVMSTLAPNLYVLRYLNATNSLTSSIKQRVIRNLKIGYHKILNYAHKDGSFSAFGYHDPAGSMFLTAFVVRTLQETRNYIYIDQRIVDKAVAWILKHQLENGCFDSMLHVFQDMGGSSTENSTAALTAYVMISLLEAGIEIPENVKTNAKYCIRGQYHLDKYTLAISSYALLKLNWYSEAERMLKKLMQISNEQNSMLWWSTKDSNGSLATDIEVTSYVLLSLLNHSTTENLANANAIVRWLSSKRGSNGGFKSTQDTVVALDALAKYSTFIASKPMDVNVTIIAINQIEKIAIKKENKLKSKKVLLKETTNTITVRVQGDGCVLAQLVQWYYMNQLPSNNAFKLDLEVASVSSVDECSIASLSPCLAYIGPEHQSNMAVLEVDLPSGYQADRASLYKLVEPDNKVKMFEEDNRKVLLYFTKLDKQAVCINFNINENAIVETRVESLIKLYDYYKPEYEVLQYFKISDKCRASNYTMPEIKNESLSKENLIKRDVGLNPDFVDLDIELQTPDGLEGTLPVYVLPPNATNSTVNDNSIKAENWNSFEKMAKRDLNTQFVDKDIELNSPVCQNTYHVAKNDSVNTGKTKRDLKLDFNDKDVENKAKEISSKRPRLRK